MTRRTLGLMLAGTALTPAFAPAKEKFKKLFNGKNLDGWEGDSRLWRVENGELVGSTEGVTLSDNTFLITKREYGDFLLRASCKLRNHNSGIQFRSEAMPNYVVKGYQADMAENNWWGSLYEEKGRGMLAEGYKGKGETVIKANDWNEYEIYCQGDQIRLTLNGLKTVELKDSQRLKGIIALQLHKGPAMEVRFRNIEIQELKAS
jgi:hypothetical protein